MRWLAGFLAVLLAACTGPAPLEDRRGKLECVDCAGGPGGALVDLGDVGVGLSVERTVVVRNSGSSPLTARIGRPGAPFSLESSELEAIEPGHAAEVVLAFRPQAEGEADVPLRIEGREGQFLDLRLRGRGEALDVDCEPRPAHFGAVVIGSERTLSMRCTNRSEVLALRLAPELTGEPAFLLPRPAWIDLAPGASAEVEVVFLPEAPIPYVGTVTLMAEGTVTATSVALEGEGIESGLRIEPPPPEGGCYALAAVPGTPASLALRAINVGNLPVHVEAPRVEPEESSFRVEPAVAFDLSGAPPLGEPDLYELRVVFEPQALGSASATLQLRSDERVNGEIDLCLEGRATGLELWPEEGLQFGRVAPGASLELRAALINVDAPDCCTVADAAIGGEGAASFSLGASLQGDTFVGPGERLELPVRFHPEVEGDHGARLELVVNGVRLFLPLSGEAARPCLWLQPAEIDFGPVAPGCVSAERTLTLSNVCAEAVTLERLVLGASLSSEFELVGGDKHDVRVPQGAAIEVPLRYLPTSSGPDAGMIEAWEEGAGRPALAALRGEGRVVQIQTDRFAEPARAAIDVLWVISNDGSGRWDEFQEVIAQSASTFLDLLRAGEVDYHIAVTTSGTDGTSETQGRCPGGVKGRESGRFFPVDRSSPRILHADMRDDDLAAAWNHNVRVGSCTNAPRANLFTAKLALSAPLSEVADDPAHPQKDDGNLGFLREHASLAIIFATHSDAKLLEPLESYLAFFRSIKGVERSKRGMLRIHTLGFLEDPESGYCWREPVADVTGDWEPSRAYLELVQATGGVFQDICAQDWTDSMSSIAEKIFEVERCYSLTSRPGPGAGGAADDPGEWFDVTVDGQEVDLQAPDGSTRFRFDEPTNQLCFAPAWSPRPGDLVTVSYAIACGQR